MPIAQLLFYIAALVLLGLAGFNVNGNGRISTGWLGMTCWLIAAVILPLTPLA